jgi:uncharacterized protein (TIGR02147 family)
MDMRDTVYGYVDFREFLKAYCKENKNRDRKFSHRYFALKLGIKSTGFLSELFQGKRNLSQQNIIRWFEVIGFNKDQSSYFDSMVHFNQAESLSEKDYWLQKMMECKKVNLTLLNKDIYEYFSKWYYAAIREMLFYYKETINPKKLTSLLCPSVKIEEVKAAVSLLERLHLIERHPDGSYSQKDAMISTGDQVNSVEVANFQIETIELAKKSINAIPAEKRDISTLTLSISENGFSKIIEILKTTKKDIIKVAGNDSNEDRVYQLNVQFFPLTRV